MAAPSYAVDLSTVNLAEVTTGWAAWGGGGAGLSASPDLALEGTNCVDKQITNAEKGMFHDNGSGWSPGADDHFYVWIFCGTPGLVDTKALRGIMAVLGSSTSAYVKFHLTGSDTLDNSEVAKCWPIRYVNTASTGVRTLVGSPGTNPQVVGGGLNTTQTVKGANLGVDGLRYGTGYYITAGDVTPNGPGDMDGVAGNDAASSFGVFQKIGGAYQLQGRLVIGQNSSGTPTAARFEQTGGAVFFTDTEHSLTDFSQIIMDHASTVVIMNGVSLTGLGTNNPGRLVVNSANPSVDLTGCTFTDMGITTLRSNCTLDGCTWVGCDQITVNSATMTDSTIEGYEGTAGTAALLYNTALATDGRLDNLTAVKGTAATHVIEFGSNIPGTVTLRGWDVSGYNASDEQNDSTIYNNSGKPITINIVGGAGNFSVRNGAAASTTIVVQPVSLTLTVQDQDEVAVSAARTHVVAGTPGSLPVDASVTITRTTTVATVTHTAHGFTVGQYVWIEGADQGEYNGVQAITTVPTANTYTYSLTGLPATPATGTITATAIIIIGVTNGSGIISDTRSYTVDQTIEGQASWVRQSSAADDPKYQTAPVRGTIDKDNGLSLIITMLPDG